MKGRDVTEIYCMDIREAHALPSLRRYVSAERQRRIDAYHQENDRRLSLAAALLARMGICILTGRDNDDLVFSRDVYGRPSAPGCDISISHSGTMAMCAVSTERAGLDCEIIKDPPLEIMDLIFTEDEKVRASSSPAAFYEVWTRKEALAKFRGTGLTDDMGLEDVLDRTDIRSFILDGYAVSICTCDDDVSSRRITEEDLISFFMDR